ncbi:MAG: GyrI-like domain-containing protein [Candidatus Helarchaeota archaeon]|nr:GyrI-like domain-containing protein [Candidatus Helarchaeota archaeon]
MPTKIDFKKKWKHLYRPPTDEVVLVEVPKIQYLMVEGKGDPNTSQEFKDTYAVLYPVAYTLKFASKAKGKDYVVMPPEALWWSDDMEDFLKGNKDQWKWFSIMMQPDFITKEMFEDAIKTVKVKKPDLPPAISKLRFEVYEEGTAAQIMHIGPYSEETANIEKIHKFIEAQGGKFDGLKWGMYHHEIYLSDPRRAKPDKMKTVIRQPFVMK